MCRVELCRTTTPCLHRWYRLLQPCCAGSTIQTCPGKLAIDGWEIKCDFCPFCDGWELNPLEFMILSGASARHGSISSAASCSSDGYSAYPDIARFRGTPSRAQPLSRRGSQATSVSSARRISRSSSQGESEVNISNDAGAVLAALEKNSLMNARIHSYMDNLPEDTGPAKPESRKKGKKERQESPPVHAVEEDDLDFEDEMEARSWKRRSRDLAKFAKRRSRDFSSMFR